MYIHNGAQGGNVVVEAPLTNTLKYVDFALSFSPL